jgi:hypothetical protein
MPVVREDPPAAVGDEVVAGADAVMRTGLRPKSAEVDRLMAQPIANRIAATKNKVLVIHHLPGRAREGAA